MSIVAALATISIHADPAGDYLIQVAPEFKQSFMEIKNLTPKGPHITDLKWNNWIQVKVPEGSNFSIQQLSEEPGVLYVQPNYKIKLFDNPLLKNLKGLNHLVSPLAQDNPEIPTSVPGGTGADPLFSKQWGMNDIGVKSGWRSAPRQKQMVVAVIDTGVDYTHEDLIENLWRNSGEMGLDAQGKDRATNGLDDDNNGYVDDTIGWDFVSNDNRPYDLKGSIFQGGNPGHGTHCAGNVAARGENGMGVSGVAPTAKIMVLRFIGEKGQGTTAAAISAIKYAVDNGAQITSNSWGSEGEEEGSPENKALRDIIRYAGANNTLFIAAAGNGHNGRGYNNDTDPRPGFPASYDIDNIISVAAIDSEDRFGGFSNWGVKSVDLGAPGVKVFSTVVGQGYTDTVIPMLKVTWDGTSMATPHVAGAAALYWSRHPSKSWQDVKQAILTSVRKMPNMQGKLFSGGKLDVEALMK
ncbi:S8 family serine peptidase [Bdellovibrionales bacterium]|nr:S8 family serine peptidase [Bdellovibrionales bacterium]